METITYNDFIHARKIDPQYYTQDRWQYYQKIIELINEIKPETVLELGAHILPIVKHCDTAGLEENNTYQMNAEQIPWAINKKYDLFIALQVWEHLGFQQQAAFQQVLRVAKKAILSFPYKWNCLGDCHYGIDDAVIKEWSFKMEPIKTIEVFTRKIYHWSFE